MKKILKICWILTGFIFLAGLILSIYGWGCGYSSGYNLLCSSKQSLGLALVVLLIPLSVFSIAYKISENNRLNKTASENDEDKQKRKKDNHFLLIIFISFIAFFLIMYSFLTFIVGVRWG
ncbi:MAG: hypothetical protein AAB446_01370 [Patescibacteria group bacterium]